MERRHGRFRARSDELRLDLRASPPPRQVSEVGTAHSALAPDHVAGRAAYCCTVEALAGGDITSSRMLDRRRDERMDVRSKRLELRFRERQGWHPGRRDSRADEIAQIPLGPRACRRGMENVRPMLATGAV